MKTHIFLGESVMQLGKLICGKYGSMHFWRERKNILKGELLRGRSRREINILIEGEIIYPGVLFFEVQSPCSQYAAFSVSRVAC